MTNGRKMQLASKADGFILDTSHVAPEDARHGGLVLVQEIFGVTEHIRELCDGFAAENRADGPSGGQVVARRFSCAPGPRPGVENLRGKVPEQRLLGGELVAVHRGQIRELAGTGS